MWRWQCNQQGRFRWDASKALLFLLTSPQAPPAMQRICSKQRLDELRTSSRDSLPYPVENEPPLVQKCRAPGYSGGELNLQPSLWFMAAICCFSASATAFLEAYVLSASGHLAVFLVGGYVVFSSYFVCDYGDARAAAAASFPRHLTAAAPPHRSHDARLDFVRRHPGRQEVLRPLEPGQGAAHRRATCRAPHERPPR